MKPQWEKEFDKQFPYLNARKVSIKTFIFGLLTKQREDIEYIKLHPIYVSETDGYKHMIEKESFEAGRASLKAELRDEVKNMKTAWDTMSSGRVALDDVLSLLDQVK